MNFKYSYILLFFVCFLISSSVYAEFPEDYYEDLKVTAGEYIKITILSVTTENDNDCKVNIKYLARILNIYRANSNLKINDEILVFSWGTRNKTSCAGGGPIPPKLLYVGWTGNAYLNTIDNGKHNFSIAAHRKSFDKEKD